ncbi:MAG TPA: patatin-like phospholipase family protein [Pyrinomonadaceae bacterium]|nr:patatin-like phospholipase family protein [Pyrinomonadaceae bacterium]
MSRTIDLLKSKRIGLALSGGAVRGLAHIGVIKALHDFGIRPAVVAGTSVGSLVGAALSAGKDWRDIAAMARSVFWPHLLHGKTLERFSVRHLPESFEQLELPFAAVATVVPSGTAFTMTSGTLSTAISASCALRVLRRPVKREGLQLKDGGFSCVLPTHACRELGADFVIGSDVWEWSSVLRSFGYSPAKAARLYPSHYRFALGHADVHIHPEIPISGYVPGATAVDRMIAVGETATHRMLASLAKAEAA